LIDNWRIGRGESLLKSGNGLNRDKWTICVFVDEKENEKFEEERISRGGFDVI
jgi:hypothetical protein